jgi:uncharacterized RDD family membrane protein YckC
MEQILDAPASSQRTLPYAGFWIRVGASFIDGIILLVVQVMLSLIFFGSAGLGESNLGLSVIMLVINLLYYCGLESSSKQATLGKMAVGIKVGDENGEQISFGNALGRYLSKILSVLILFIGYMMVGWDEKKQGLHDKIAGTYVFYAPAN